MLTTHNLCDDEATTRARVAAARVGWHLVSLVANDDAEAPDGSPRPPHVLARVREINPKVPDSSLLWLLECELGDVFLDLEVERRPGWAAPDPADHFAQLVARM